MSHRPTLTAALYARVSSEQQAQQQSIASQIAALRERIAADGYALLPELCFTDDGYSGSTLLRPALERLRDQAALGAIERLYVLAPDRLARNYAYQVLLLEELQRAGVAVTFLNRALGDSPEDQLLLQVQGVIAEYERTKILERSRRGTRHQAREGSLSVLGAAPFGYRYVPRRDGQPAAYEVVEAEAAIVRQLFHWVGVDGCSLAEVCRRLGQQGVASPRGRAAWDRSTVWGILKNSAYQGLALYGKTRSGPRRAQLRPPRGQPQCQRKTTSAYRTPPEEQVALPVPALVSAALFAAVAERLEENRRRHRQHQGGARYLLQGLVVCQRCGYALYGKPTARVNAAGLRVRYVYYRCFGQDGYRALGEKLCGNRGLRVDVLEEAVWADVCGLLSQPGRIEQEYARRCQGGPSAGADEDGRLTKRLQRAKAGLARLLDAYEAGLVERAEFEARVRRLQEEVKRVEGQRAAAQSQRAAAEELRGAVSQVEAFARRVQQGLAEASWQARREIIRALVKRVEVNEEEVRVIYKVPPHPFVEGPERGRLQDCGGRFTATPSPENCAGAFRRTQLKPSRTPLAGRGLFHHQSLAVDLSMTVGV
jgi:site-specific DNA recombinase